MIGARRFASPYSAEFTHIDCCDVEGGKGSTVALADSEGRVFILDVRPTADSWI